MSVEYKPNVQKLYAVIQIKPYKGTRSETDSLVRDISTVNRPWRRDYIPRDTAKGNVVEIIKKRDPRAKSSRMKEAIRKEIAGLLERGVFKVIMKEDIPKNANVMGGRSVICIKETGTQEERYKA